METSKPRALLTRSLRSARSLGAAVVEHIDALPFTPAKLADRAMDKLHDERKLKAAKDSRWATIEARRHTPGSASMVFLGEDLTMADWETQRSIETALVPDPWWLPIARRAQGTSVEGSVRRIEHATQRVRRGWDDTYTWNLGTNVARQLADQLDHLAAHAHGWPATDEFPTFESWMNALRATAADLRRAGDTPEAEAARDAWYALSIDPDADPDALDAARATMISVEEDDHAAATAAMHWVADHLHMLWD